MSMTTRSLSEFFFGTAAMLLTTRTWLGSSSSNGPSMYPNSRIRSNSSYTFAQSAES